MKKLGPVPPRDLLEVFVRRHEAASTLITTNRPTQDWGLFLGDVPAATAILDRFLAHAADRPDDPARAIATTAHGSRRQPSPWTLPMPWTDRTRPPHLGNHQQNFRKRPPPSSFHG